MDLKKVIFVDADQIVRADLKELVDLDLHGAPYGYTPMGDDNVEMEGFRFWKTGYWKEFLQDLPYHIRYVRRRTETSKITHAPEQCPLRGRSSAIPSGKSPSSL